MKKIVEQIKNHYASDASDSEIDVEVENNTISVTITYQGDSIESFTILPVKGYKVTCSAWSTAITSWCERYGVVDELNIYITYIPN